MINSLIKANHFLLFHLILAIGSSALFHDMTRALCSKKSGGLDKWFAEVRRQ